MEKIDESNKSKLDWFQITEIWKEISTINLHKPDTTLWIRRAFKEKIWTLISEQRKIKWWKYKPDDNKIKSYYKTFSNTTNGDILVNPSFDLDWEALNISNTEIWYYHSYHALNWLNNWLWNDKKNLKNINYKPLSAWWIVFDEKSESFVLFKRPNDSQESPWEIDLIWWVMNMRDWLDEDWTPNPEKFTNQRIQHKTWIEVDNFKVMWVQWFKERWFFNIVYLWFVNWIEGNEEKKNNYSLVHINEVEKYIEQDNPWGSWLLLSLSNSYFEKYWWWKDKVNKEFERLKK
jgi:hypothetical protein